MSERLKALQTSSPEKLVIIKQIKATNIDERCIHKELNKYRIRGEWFEDVSEVKNKIETIQDLRT